MPRDEENINLNITFNIGDQLRDVVREISHLLQRGLNTQQGEQIMKSIQDLIDDVTSESTIIDSLGVMIQGLRDQVTAANGDPALIQQAFDAIEANKAKLTAALAANTPAEPVTPVDPTPVDTTAGSDAVDQTTTIPAAPGTTPLVNPSAGDGSTPT